MNNGKGSLRRGSDRVSHASDVQRSYDVLRVGCFVQFCFKCQLAREQGMRKQKNQLTNDNFPLKPRVFPSKEGESQVEVQTADIDSYYSLKLHVYTLANRMFML